MTILFIFIVVFGLPLKVRGYDPWKSLKELFVLENVPQKVNRSDPWMRIRKLYLPVSEKGGDVGLTHKQTSYRINVHFCRMVEPYANIITKCSRHFKIPVSIIQAVIMVESGGNPNASNKLTSAKGLMQTIDSTFEDARKALINSGILIKDDPFDPRSSIYAGCWYLDRMYCLVYGNSTFAKNNRQNLWSWQKPLEYYYVGPKNGKKDKKVIICYGGGVRKEVDKSLYAKKIIKWAKILEEAG